MTFWVSHKLSAVLAAHGAYPYNIVHIDAFQWPAFVYRINISTHLLIISTRRTGKTLYLAVTFRGLQAFSCNGYFKVDRIGFTVAAEVFKAPKHSRFMASLLCKKLRGDGFLFLCKMCCFEWKFNCQSKSALWGWLLKLYFSFCPQKSCYNLFCFCLSKLNAVDIILTLLNRTMMIFCLKLSVLALA